MKNGDHNSLERDLYFSLIESLVEHDYVDLWSSELNRKRDLGEIRSRVNREGLTFLTKALPSLGKALDRALSTNTPLETPVGFKTYKSTRLPVFLREPFKCIFDDSGELLPSASARSVAGLRQLTLMFYKLNLPYAYEDSKRVLDGFVECDESLSPLWGVDFSVDPILRRARGLISSVLGSVDPTHITPRHGTGAVATRERVLEKSKFSRIYSTVEAKYPFTEYFRFTLQHTCDTLDEIQRLEMISEPSARVCLVPKDSRGPRIISMEPLEIQWLQQGLMTPVVRAIGKHQLTKGRVNFADQEVNRRLALEGSVSDLTVTLDMKEASDRVSLPLVQYLFGGTRLLEGLMATRSTQTVLPDGRIVKMNKFAPMGSALCFPVESLVFWAICCSVLWTGYGYSKHEAAAQIHVFGDDLIVPKQHWVAISDKLRDVHLLINQEKCCVAKHFRESCGMDAFKGLEVTPVRIKRRITGALHEWLPAYVEISNLCERRGLHRAAHTIETAVRQGLEESGYSKGIVPYTDEPCGVLSFVRPYASNKYNKVFGAQFRYNRKLQRGEVRGLQVRDKKLKPTYDGYDELLRSWHQYEDSVGFTRTCGSSGSLFSDVYFNAIGSELASLLVTISYMDLFEYELDDAFDLSLPTIGTWEKGVNAYLAQTIVNVQDKGIKEFNPLDPSSARGNTYVDRRVIKLRRAWSAVR